MNVLMGMKIKDKEEIKVISNIYKKLELKFFI